MKEMVGGCCVCSDERGWPENPLVYCDGQNCTVAVHQACYGIVTVPTGPWYCRKCESQERPARVRCELCPSRDGALKRTDNQGWAHVVCALYIPEVRFGNVTTMEPIILQLIPSERYAKTCYICQEIGKPNRANVGACMQCNKFNCKQQFHVTCAQSLGLLCEEAGNYLDNVKYCGYCQHHYSKLKKGGNVKTIPPYKPITHDSSGSDSGSSPEKEIDSTASATASSTSATSIKITNAIGSSSTSTSGPVGLSSTKQRKSSIASKQSNLTSSTSGVSSGVSTNLSGTNVIVPGNSGSSSLVGPSSSIETASNNGGNNLSVNLTVGASKSNSGSLKEKDKHSKNLSKIISSKDKEKELSSSSSSSSSSREKGNKSKNKDCGELNTGGTGIAVGGGGVGAPGSGQNSASLATRAGLGMDTSLSTSDNVFPATDIISNPPPSALPMKNSGGSIAKKRKADSKAGIFGDANDINHSFRDIIKDVSVTLTPLPLDKTSDLGEVEKLSKKQKTELSPPTHQSIESSIPNISPKHLQSTRNHSHSAATTLQTQNVTPVESSITSSTTPSPSSAPHHKPTKERDERLRSSSPYTPTVSSVPAASVTAGCTTASSAPSLYVSVPLSTANVPGLNLPTITTTDQPTPSQSTRAATQQQQSAIIERQSPRIHHQVTSSPAVSEHGSFSSSLPSPANAVVLQSGKSPSPSITGGNLTATTTESGNLKISYEKQNSRVAQLQEQESAPVRRSRSRSGEHSNLIQTKPRIGKKRSAVASSTQLAKSSSSSSLTAGSSEQLQQPQQPQQRSTPSVPLTSHTPDVFSETSQKSQPPSPVPPLAAPPPPTPVTSSPKIIESDIIGNNSSLNSNSNSNNNNNNSNHNAINLSSSAPSTPTPTPPPIPSTSTTTTIPSSLSTSSTSASVSNFTTTSSSSPQTTATCVKSNNSKNSSSESVNSTMAALIINSCRNSCSPITPSPPAPSTPTHIPAVPPVVSNMAASKTLNKKLLRAQQSHFLQQQQLAAIQQQQQTPTVGKTVDVAASTAPPSSLPIDDSNSNTNPPPPTISRTPDSGIFSSSFNISGSSQSSLSAAIPSVNGGLKFTYEAQPGVVSTATPPTIDTNLNSNAALKDSPPSSPGSEAGSARKRGRKSNEMKDVKVFQNGGCAVSTPVNTPTPGSTSNGPMQATHMLGNQLNPTSNVAQKLTDQLHMEMQDHSVYTETQPPQFVGVPFPSKPVNNVRNPPSMPSSANSLASMFGGNGGGYAPQSLEQLLERQWEQGSQFLMEQAQHFDIASLLSCLHQLQTENVRLEEHVNSLIARRDHLLAVNARLAIPLNANVPQSQVNLNNIHLNGPTQPDVVASPAATAAPPPASVPPTSSANSQPVASNPTTSSRAPRSSAPASAQLPTMENGIDFRHSSHQQPTSVSAPGTAPQPALAQSTTSNSLRHSSSVHPNFSTTTPSSSASHHSNHQHHQHQTHQHHHQQQQQPSLAQHSSMSSSASNVNSVMTSASRQTQLQAPPPPPHHHPQQPQHSHQQTHHPQHHNHHGQQQQQQHQQQPQQQQQQQQALHPHHQHTQHQSHSLVQQHSHNHHHPSSTGPPATHHMQQPTTHHQMSMSSNEGSMRTTGGGSNSGSGRVGNSSVGGVGVAQMLPGRPGHVDNSNYHPVYSHQSQLRRDDTQGKAS